MKSQRDDCRLLASLAVFRELYDSKKGIYDIIAEFIKEVIIVKVKHSFNITEITHLLNNYYDFKLPEAIVKASLFKLDFLEKSNGHYRVNNLADIKKSNLEEIERGIEKDNELLFNRLIFYIEKQNKEEVNQKKKGEIIDSFCSFILDDINGEKYYEYISAFIIENKFDNEFSNKINTIKEGVILYSGIKYSNYNIDLCAWDIPLKIYIDTEVLFNFAGFDGTLYKILFTDFLDLVKEINEKNNKQIIKLFYFRDTIQEIENFFVKAEQIVTGRARLIPTRTAMSNICDGCKTASDVVQKKNSFYNLLKRNEIYVDNYKEYFSINNHKFNIADQSTIDKITNSLRIGDITEHLKLLNYINILRADSFNNNFENIGSILLSGNKKTYKVAWHKEIKQRGVVPLVTDLNFITSKLWVKLNKGFGANTSPKSFNVIARAQIVLSTHLNDSVRLKYDKLYEKFKNDELSEEEAVATIANLRELSLNPEDIEPRNLSDVLNTITDDKIEWYIKEKQHLKNKVREESEKSSELSQNLIQKEKKIEEYINSENKLSLEIIATKKRLLDEKLNSITILEKQKEPIDLEVNRAVSIYKSIAIGLLIFTYALSYYLIWKFGWNNFEKWTWIVSFTFPAIICGSYMFVKEKTLNPIEMLKNKKNEIRIQKYKKFSFDRSLLEKLINESEMLKAEINCSCVKEKEEIVTYACTGSPSTSR